MADGILLKKGSGFDNSGLTATPKDVKENVLFLGSGSTDPQKGEMKIISPIQKQMSVNESYSIPAGFHNGEDKFFQSGIPIEAGQIIDPGAGGITLDVTGKYLDSNTIVMDVENLRPEVIKKGVWIGNIVGEYEGFPDEE